MKILLGMSGGIDSSAAAILLKERGHDVLGLSIRFYDENSFSGFFNTKLDKNINDAAIFCQLLGIQHHVVDARKEFLDIVVDYFTGGYLAGRTPFPCIVCNKEVKWKMLCKKMEELACNAMATGHYANILDEDGKYYITEGIDDEKDQSFFLWPLDQDVLKKAIFPLGQFTKTKVKLLVSNYAQDLPKKKESTGICFLNQPDYRPFLKAYLKKHGQAIGKGYFYNKQGKIIGEHQGYPFYTIGQRKGLGLNTDKALYVESICPKTNKIVLGDKSSLYKTTLWVKNHNIVDKSDFENKITVKIRYRKQANLGKISIIDDKLLKVQLDEPVDSVALGQTAVFYENSKLLGGGFIEGAE